MLQHTLMSTLTQIKQDPVRASANVSDLLCECQGHYASLHVLSHPFWLNLHFSYWNIFLNTPGTFLTQISWCVGGCHARKWTKKSPNLGSKISTNLCLDFCHLHSRICRYRRCWLYCHSSSSFHQRRTFCHPFWGCVDAVCEREISEISQSKMENKHLLKKPVCRRISNWFLK